MVLVGLALGLGYAFAPDLRQSAVSTSASGSRGVVINDTWAVSVIDGDTFRYRGEKIRIADIDTPETHPPRCAYEADLGERATQRLGALLKAGPFTLEPIDRDRDVYGRQLRIVTRNGQSIGDTLVTEGLARPYSNGRRPWCT